MPFYNLKISYRYLVKNKIYTTLIIGGFSIGFAVYMLIMFFYFTEKKVNKGFANHGEIYRLYDSKANSYNLNYDFSAVLQESSAEIVGVCPMDYFNGMEFIAKDETGKHSVLVNNIVCTTNSFPEVFSATIVHSESGRLFDGLASFAVSRTMATKLFGSENAVGNTLEFGNTFIKFKGKITSVIEDIPQNSTFKADILLNGENKEFRFSTSCDKGVCWNPTNTFIQLHPNADAATLISSFNKRVNLAQYHIEELGFQRFDDIYLSSLPIKDMHFKGNAKLLKIFLLIAGLVLFLSAINYVNYMVTQQYMKFRSIGISKTNGASWRQLAWSTLTEAFLGISMASVLSVLLLFLLLPFSFTLFGKQLVLDSDIILQVSPVMLGTLGLFITLISLFTLYFQSRFKIAEFMAGKRTRKGKQAGKQVLLTFQLAVSIALIAVVFGISKQLFFVKHADLGFNKELLCRIDMPGQNANKNAFRQEIAKFPFVQETAFSEGCPGKITLRMGSNMEDNNFTVSCIIMDDNFMKTMGIEMLEGRELHEGDRNNVCLLNESAFRQYGYDNIEGKRFMNGKEGGYEIVGIIKDFRIGSFYNAIEPVALIYDPEHASGVLSIRLKPGNMGAYSDQLKGVWKKFLPDELMSITFYDQQFQSMYLKEEKLVQSISFFSIVAIILTCMGILSQVIVTSLIRTKEIGIRKVNGARSFEILAMLNSDFTKVVGIAFVIACPVAWYAIRYWLQNFANKTPMNWWVFAAAGMVALVITLLTVSWQSWRTANMNPVEALRWE